MKAIFGASVCLVGALLQGCVGAQGVDDGVEDDVAEDGVPGASQSAGPAEIDAKIAVVDVAGGQVAFVDEGLTEPGAGIAFWEIGNVDLSYLLDEENATALEVFLAITPEGTAPPRRLVEHHAEVARRVGGIPAEPRRFLAGLSLPEHTSLTNEGLGDYGSDTDKNCWGWAGTTSAYSSNYGYRGFVYPDYQSAFNTYSQIPSGINTTSGMDIMDVNPVAAEATFATTSAGHERAIAACLSKAVTFDGSSYLGTCYSNTGHVNIEVSRTTDSAYSNWVVADSIHLDAFGHGARFRSNYTNSGGGARKYRMFGHWPYAQGDDLACGDEVVAAWRSRWAPPLGS